MKEPTIGIDSIGELRPNDNSGYLSIRRIHLDAQDALNMARMSDQVSPYLERLFDVAHSAGRLADHDRLAGFKVPNDPILKRRSNTKERVEAAEHAAAGDLGRYGVEAFGYIDNNPEKSAVIATSPFGLHAIIGFCDPDAERNFILTNHTACNLTSTEALTEISNDHHRTLDTICEIAEQRVTWAGAMYSEEFYQKSVLGFDPTGAPTHEDERRLSLLKPTWQQEHEQFRAIVRMLTGFNYSWEVSLAFEMHDWANRGRGVDFRIPPSY